MATLNLLFQAVTPQYHAAAIRDMLRIAGLRRFVGSVAFVRSDGVNAIADAITPVADKVTFYVGVRNEITSVQGLRRLLELGVRVYTVDTASRSVIFHPKVFAARTSASGTVLIGSANLTFSGLHNNVEAGALVNLDLSTAADRTFFDETNRILAQLPSRFPANVVRATAANVTAMFDEGRLADEDVSPVVVGAAVRRGARDALRRMQLHAHERPLRVRRARGTRPVAAVALAIPIPAATPPQELTHVGHVPIWESKPLRERDLNIPSGETTHATGSMLWKKGALDSIDQRHFFRDEVFAGLNWQADPQRPHIERASAPFQIIVKGVHAGEYRLRLSHNTDTASRSYQQSNSMTQIHWGAALPVIAKPDLLGRTMVLSRKEGEQPSFLIEID